LANYRQRPLKLQILSGTPKWFFESSLSFDFDYQPLETDVGLVQRTPLLEDLSATEQKLTKFYPISESQLQSVSRHIQQPDQLDFVLCDIAPLGIQLAQQWNCPSVLVENFTWPWIYRSYSSRSETLLQMAAYIEELLNQVTIHLQTIPYCHPVDHPQRYTINTIARRPKMTPEQVRDYLQIESQRPLVMASMGGIPDHYECVDALQKLPYTFILAGSHSKLEWQNNCLLLPHHSDLYHPDLVHASDVLVGKLGYSTLAEVSDAFVGFCYLTRPHFPESPCLQNYVDQHLKASHLSIHDFYAGNWQAAIQSVLNGDWSQLNRPSTDGARQAAQIIHDVIE
jgi:hypothetical protein